MNKLAVPTSDEVVGSCTFWSVTPSKTMCVMHTYEKSSATLFVLMTNWKQPDCPSVGEWLKF